MKDDSHKHEVSEKHSAKDTSNDSSNDSAKKIVLDSLNSKDNKNVIEQRKDNAEANKTIKSLFGQVAIDFSPEAHKAQQEAAAEAKPESENVKPTIVSNMKNLAGVMDKETIEAVRRNEENKAGFEDTIQDSLPYSWAKSRNWSIGPAQMQPKHIEDLKTDARYADELKDANPYSEEGSDKLIAAYFDREAERFNNGEYGAGKSGRPRDNSPKEAERFEALQRRWDEAKNNCNPEEMRKILIETYNSGNGSKQVAEVESIRTGEATQTASVAKERKSIVAPQTEGQVAA
ncbi:MAG: hypothetical protein WCT03_03170 [Candidatus Obscuribacterales bacterium]|jgi:hypothetical protein